MIGGNGAAIIKNRFQKKGVQNNRKCINLIEISSIIKHFLSYITWLDVSAQNVS